MDPETPDIRRRAVALRYDAQRDGAPKVIAKGAGHIADRIMALAEEHGVVVHHDPDLVGLLAQLDVQAEIPEHLYRAVAEVLAFVYRLNQSFPK
jgi:flagellar biosynthesis protein